MKSHFEELAGQHEYIQELLDDKIKLKQKIIKELIICEEKYDLEPEFFRGRKTGLLVILRFINNDQTPSNKKETKRQP